MESDEAADELQNDEDDKDILEAPPLLNVLVGAMVFFVSWSWRDAHYAQKLTLGVKSEFWGLEALFDEHID